MGNNKSKALTKSDVPVTKLLINGYIRKIQKNLKNLIIPDSINTICWMYYSFSHRKLIFFLSNDPHNDCVHFTYINKNASIWSTDFWRYNWKINSDIGVCSTRNLKSFSNRFSKYNFSHNPIVIFVCGHGRNIHSTYEHQCYSAIIMDANLVDLHQLTLFIDNENKIKSDRWELPYVPLLKLGGNSLSFSENKQVLYSIGGKHEYNMKNLLYYLDFNDDINNIATWKWKKINCDIGVRYSASTVIINKYDKLFIVGGYNINALNKLDIYDIQHNKLQKGKSCNIGRYYAGIGYNEYNDDIYIGGGSPLDSASNSFEYYNIKKNEWYPLPDTSVHFSCNPILWLENDSVLYVAGWFNTWLRSQFIDLREGKKWNIYSDSLSRLSKPTNTKNCRLLIV